MGGMRPGGADRGRRGAGRRPRRSAQANSTALHDAFIPWLATINPDNDQPMRRVARWDDLPDASRPLIEALVDKRLLVKDTRDGQVVVEVALESLLRQWDELAGWLRDERQDLKTADDLERTAAAWAHQRPRPRLAAGPAPGSPTPKPWPPHRDSATASTPPATTCRLPGRRKRAPGRRGTTTPSRTPPRRTS